MAFLLSLSLSHLLFDTSKQVNFANRPISGGKRCNLLLSNHNSCNDGKKPMHIGNTSISLSPKSKRSNFRKLIIDSGKLFSKFSRNSSDSNNVKLKIYREKEEEKKICDMRNRVHKINQ